MSDNIEVRRLTAYSSQDAEAIGALIPFVNHRYDGSPITEDVMVNIIDSDRSDQYVAEMNSRIVGAMTLNLLVTPNARKAYLDNFVTHPDFRQRGVGSAMWLEIQNWCRDQNVRLLDFVSGTEKDNAHGFYAKRGVETIDNLVLPFRVVFED